MLHFEIEHDPALTNESLRERLRGRLPDHLSCLVAPGGFRRGATRVLVHDHGTVGVGVRLRQGPRATVLSIDRELTSLPSWFAFLPRIAKNLLALVYLAASGGEMLASVRSLVVDSGEFRGPAGNKPQSITAGRARLLAQPEWFFTLAGLKLLVGLAMVGFVVFAFVVEPAKDLIPAAVGLAAFGGRWLYTGLSNFRWRIPSFAASLVPFALGGALAVPLALGMIAWQRSAKTAAEEEAWQKVAAGGPVYPYFEKYVAGQSYGVRPEFFTLWAERGVLLIRASRSVPRDQPETAAARNQFDARLAKIEALADRALAADVVTDERKIRSAGYRLDAERRTIRAADPVEAERLRTYLFRNGVGSNILDDPATVALEPTADPAAVGKLLEGPAAGSVEQPLLAEFDRNAIRLSTDDPEAPYVIVPAQYARSLQDELDRRWYVDWKWDEALYAQGKLVLQVPTQETALVEEALAKWKPVENFRKEGTQPFPFR